jgi:hypothetical protein
MALLGEGERFGSLEVVGLVSAEDAEEPKYRLLCTRCESDCVTATQDALLAGRVSQCWPCAQLHRLTPHERTVLAFRRSLHLSPPMEELDRVDSLPATSAPLTIAQALAA